VRRLAGLSDRPHGDRYGVSTHVCLARPVDPWVHVHFARDHELYLTPVGPHELNVAMLTRKAGMHRFAGNLASAFESFISTHPAIPARSSPAGEVLAAGPFLRRARRAFRGNIVLVGDAAGFFDGITGEGMSLALVSARLAARAIIEHLGSGSVAPFRRYHDQRQTLARNSELLGHLTLLLGPRPRLARWSARNLARQPTTFERLAAIGSESARSQASAFATWRRWRSVCSSPDARDEPLLRIEVLAPFREFRERGLLLGDPDGQEGSIGK
jgi:flavin-dependent dehydrogenase